MFEFSTLTDPAEEQRLRDILRQSFRLPDDYWETYVRRIGRSNLRVLRRAGQVVGGLSIYRMGQWFGGRRLESAGIAAVGIAPEHRSAGAAAHLMASALVELYEQGVAISALYPSTQRLYRKVGYEQAGSRCDYRLPLASIGRSELSAPMTRVEGIEHEPYYELARTRARITNGNLDRSAGLWERIVTYPYGDRTVYRYLIGEPDAPEGYLMFYQDADKQSAYDLYVRDMIALSPSAVQTLWRFLSYHQSVSKFVFWSGPAVEPLLLLPAELHADVTAYKRWMLRLVDVRKALRERGYPPEVEADLHFNVVDDIVSANNGQFILNVANGRGEIRDGGRGDLKAHVRDLSPLFSGLLSPTWLRCTGHIEAGDQAVATATSIFAGPPPWMPDSF